MSKNYLQIYQYLSNFNNVRFLKISLIISVNLNTNQIDLFL